MNLGYSYTEIGNGIADVAKTRQAEYDERISRITSQVVGLTDMGDFARLDSHREYREWMAVAGQFAIDKADAH